MPTAPRRSRARENDCHTQCELDASNAFDVQYEGKTTDRLRRLENRQRRLHATLHALRSSVEDMCALQGSRLVTCDNNFKRRQTQLVISTVLPVQIFGDAK